MTLQEALNVAGMKKKKIALGIRLTPLSCGGVQIHCAEKAIYDEFRLCAHECGGGEILLLPPARSEASDLEPESSPVLVLREDEPRILAPAASDPIPEIVASGPDPTTPVAPMD